MPLTNSPQLDTHWRPRLRVLAASCRHRGQGHQAGRQKECRFKRCCQFWTKEGLRNLRALDEAHRNRHWEELWSPN